MESVNRVGTRDRGKEEYWRKVLKQFGESKQSQSAFCRERGLNQNTFSYWKSAISDRDAEAARSIKAGRSRPPVAVRPGVPATPQPVFARFAISDLEAEPGAPSPQSTQSESPGIAAELVDASNGRRVRIFNGADQATVAAVLSALTSLSAGRMGF
jgi:hypothetical protein